ncbi:MAG: type II secretion system F family protein [Thermodesulfobacteriota bacterium]
MAAFRYEAINSAGRMVEGTHVAELAVEVEEWLLKNGLSPVSILVLSDQATTAPQTHGMAARPSLGDRLFGVSLEDRILFCRQLSTLLSAGVNIVEALSTLAVQVENPVLRDIILAMGGEIENGASLSDTVELFPKAFSPLFRNMVRVGEETGSLDRAFSYLASLFENEKTIRERIKSATRYPKIVVTALTGAIFFLMTFVVPKFTALFSSAKVELPLPTRILIAISGFFANNYLLLLAGLAVMIVVYRLALNVRAFVLFRDRLLLRIPIFGPLSAKLYMSRFCRVFSVLTRSGIDIITTLQLSATALENLVLFDMMEEITSAVTEGISLHDAMGRHAAIPPMVRQMAAVGEQSGRLDDMMDQVANYYDMESDYTIKNLSTLIEPALLLALGIMVGLMALAIFLPMWSMMDVARGGGR